MLAQKTVPTLKCAVALSRILQRRPRMKKEKQMQPAAAASQPQLAAAMVPETLFQLTPRREKYNSTAASKAERIHDHVLRRPGGRVLPGSGMAALLFHEVVRNDVEHHHVGVLDVAH